MFKKDVHNRKFCFNIVPSLLDAQNPYTFISKAPRPAETDYQPR